MPTRLFHSRMALLFPYLWTFILFSQMMM